MTTDPGPWPDDNGELDRVLAALPGARKQGGVWMARCPAHEDRKASLQVARGTKHPVLVHCFAGCDRDDILAAIGMTLEDISAPRDERDDPELWTPRGPAVAVYDYTDEDGKLLYQVLRTTGKEFPQRVPDPLSRTGWRWKLGDTRRVLYRLPKVLAAIDAGEPVWVVEGEKDVHALEAQGVTATCNPGGAGKWMPAFSEVFREAAVTIVADKDAPGRAHARQVAASLALVDAAVDICEAAIGKDVTDHLAAGKPLADLLTTRHGQAAEAEVALDLRRFLAGSDPAIMWVLRDLLERGDRLILTGNEGLGKSMLVRQIALAAAIGIHPFTNVFCKPQRVLFIDCENSLRKSRRRFRVLDDVAEVICRPLAEGQFTIIHHLAGMDLTREEGAARLLEATTAYEPDLLVIGPLYKLLVGDASDETNARKITQALDAAVEVCEPALIVEAHSPKGTGGPRRPIHPAGSRLFLAWPDLGYGIRPADKSKKHVKMINWRGDRDERRYPWELKWGATPAWPWTVPPKEQPHNEDEFPEDPQADPVEPTVVQGVL